MEWNQIPYCISLKDAASHVPTVLSLDNGDTITNPCDIANTFKNYFAPIAETTKKSIKYLHKHFSNYLSNETSRSTPPPITFSKIPPPFCKSKMSPPFIGLSGKQKY